MPLPSSKFNTPPVNEATQGRAPKGRKRSQTLSTGEVITREVPEKRPRLAPVDPTAAEKTVSQEESACNPVPAVVDSPTHIMAISPFPKRGRPYMDVNAAPALFVTTDRPADMTGFTEFAHTTAVGKNAQGVKYTAGDRRSIVVTKTYFTEPKAKPTKEEAKAARDAQKAKLAAMTPQDLLAKLDADEIARSAAVAKRRAEILAKLNQPQAVGA